MNYYSKTVRGSGGFGIYYGWSSRRWEDGLKNCKKWSRILGTFSSDVLYNE